MIIFKKEDEDIYLITNYKVMFSTLSTQSNLIRITPGKKEYLKALMSWIGFKSKFYLIARNPYERIQSFYKSKFLKADKNRIWLQENKKGNWEICTEYFFPYVGISTNEDPCEIGQKLMQVSFNEVISLLPHVYLKDGHTRPQSEVLAFKKNKYGLNIRIPIKFNRIFKIEEAKDLEDLSKRFDLDLSRKVNNTTDLNQELKWEKKSVEIVKTLYHQDFENFEYKKELKAESYNEAL